MKTLIAILVGIALVGFCSAASAEIVLSDKDMGELYAGRHKDKGIEITDIDEVKDINEISSFQSAVAAQSNIAAIEGKTGINDGDITQVQLIDPLVNAEGESAVGFQSNIAAAYSKSGTITGSDIYSANTAEVLNSNYDDRHSTLGSVQGSSIEVTHKADINDVYSTLSAIAVQSNIGTIVTGWNGGSVVNSNIEQRNTASVINADTSYYPSL